jgi:hypothetical protein
MNSTELDSPSQPLATGGQDFQKQIDGLQNLLAVALGLMLVVGGSLAGYLYGQNRVVKASLRDTEAFIKDYNERAVPKLKEIQAALQKYGDTHPDIAPILQKYRITDPKLAAPPAAPKK